MVFDRLLFERVALHDNVVFPFEYEAVQYEVLFFEEVCLLEERDYFLAIYIVIAFLDIHGNKIELWFVHFLPLLDKPLVLFHDVIIVEDCKAKLMLEHLGLEVLQHHVCHIQFLVGGHVFRMWQLSIKCHDWPEGLTLWYETQLTWCKIVIFTMALHLSFLDESERLFEKILD